MPADPEKTVTVTIDENGNFTIVATHTETYPERPVIASVERKTASSVDPAFQNTLKEKSMAWTPTRKDPKQLPAAGVQEIATLVLTAGGAAPGSYVVRVNCSGTIFPVPVTVPQNGRGTGSIKFKDLPKPEPKK